MTPAQLSQPAAHTAHPERLDLTDEQRQQLHAAVSRLLRATAPAARTAPSG